MSNNYDYDKKIKKFKDLVSELENKHIEFLKTRPNKIHKQDHDRLVNHFTTSVSNGNTDGVRFFINEKSDLTEPIKQEIQDAFNLSFL